MTTARQYIKQSGLSLSEVENLIDEWIFSEKDRYILKRILLDNASYEKISEEVKLSSRYTKSIAAKAMNELKTHITITSSK